MSGGGPQWLALGAAARALGVSRDDLLALVRAGRIRARLVSASRWFVSTAEIRRVRLLRRFPRPSRGAA